MVGELAGVPGPVEGPRLEVDDVVAPSPTLTAEARFDLYRRGYRLRLLECLRAMHPALRHALGDDLFDGFALDYLAVHPSTSYTLARLDEGFAAHLEATRPASGESWPDFLVDVVRFERAFLEVYDGEGVEGVPVAGATDVVAAAAAGAAVAVDPVPCLRLLRSTYPVGDYVRAVRRGERPPLPLPRPTWLALVRRDWVVDVVPLEAESFAALADLVDGAATSDETVLGRVESWADQGLFVRIRQLDTAPISPKGITCS
jgi:hypothetical protein